METYWRGPGYASIAVKNMALDQKLLEDTWYAVKEMCLPYCCCDVILTPYNIDGYRNIESIWTKVHCYRAGLRTGSYTNRVLQEHLHLTDIATNGLMKIMNDMSMRPPRLDAPKVPVLAKIALEVAREIEDKYHGLELDDVERIEDARAELRARVIARFRK